jgi:hypothetical protein
MPAQETIMDTVQSRRRFLGVLSAGAASAIAPAAASTLTAPAKPDPIFALIAELREAWDRYDAADEIHAELREKADEEGLYDLPKIHLRDYPEKKAEVVVYNDEEWHTRFTRTGKMLPIFASHPADIKKNAPPELTKSQRAYWVRKKKRELQLAEEAKMELINNSECSRAWRVWNTAHKELGAATMRLVAARPTTIAGVMAAMELWKEAEGLFEDDGLWDECLPSTVEAIMATLAEALRNIVEQV